MGWGSKLMMGWLREILDSKGFFQKFESPIGHGERLGCGGRPKILPQEGRSGGRAMRRGEESWGIRTRKFNKRVGSRRGGAEQVESEGNQPQWGSLSYAGFHDECVSATASW